MLEAESSSTSIICVCVGGGEGCRVVLPERPWCVRAAKTPASLCALESAGNLTGNDEIINL